MIRNGFACYIAKYRMVAFIYLRPDTFLMQPFKNGTKQYLVARLSKPLTIERHLQTHVIQTKSNTKPQNWFFSSFSFACHLFSISFSHPHTNQNMYFLINKIQFYGNEKNDDYSFSQKKFVRRGSRSVEKRSHPEHVICSCFLFVSCILSKMYYLARVLLGMTVPVADRTKCIASLSGIFHMVGQTTIINLYGERHEDRG